MVDYGIGSVLSGLTGALSGMAANSTNVQLARESRDWQTDQHHQNSDQAYKD